MAAEPRTRPADPASGQNCQQPGAREPSSNGRPACAHSEIHRNGAAVSEQVATTVGLSGAEAGAAWFETVIQQFEGPLVRYAAQITGDLERGRDVVQETFLRLCREPAVASRDHLGQWLFTVCRRLAIDVRRKEKRMSTQLEGAAVCEAPAQGVARLEIEQAEELGNIVRLLGRLPANQQEVVRLKFQEGMAYKQIAAITGLSVSNVGYLLHTAVMALREGLVVRE
jgi:RNA polymerase sigma factor (sigma-70 family)